MKKYLITLFVCILSFCIAPISQANFITNGNFDTGLDGWSTSGDVDWETGGASPLSGGYALLGSDSTSATSILSQSFAIADGTERLAVSFSYKFTGVDTSSYNYDSVLATLRQYIWGGALQIASNELLSLVSPNEFGSGTYYGEVNVADWLWWDANLGNLRFILDESNTSYTNTQFAVDNVNVAAPVPEPSTLMLILLAGPVCAVGAGIRKKMIG